MKILMVCLGNICRSPIAEGVLRHLVQARGLGWTVDSAGTANYHVGEAPDHRARAAMKRNGMNIDTLRGRQVAPYDFHRFDLLLAMDVNNINDLQRTAPDPTSRRRVKLLMDFHPVGSIREVPDPYHGDDSDFDHVFNLVIAACENLLDQHDGTR